MLLGLPSRLKVEIQIWRYEAVLKKSKFFQNFGDISSEPLISSIMKCVNYEIFMPEEIVVVAGIHKKIVFIVKSFEIKDKYAMMSTFYWKVMLK